MAFKFIFIAAICVAQGFALKPDLKVPRNAVDVTDEIPQDFDEAMQDMEEVSMAAVDAYIKGKDPKVIAACFEAQRENYTKVGQKIVQQLKAASEEMAQELGDNYEKYAEKAEVPIKTIGLTMKSLPERMWEYVKDYEFAKALEVMRESRRVVEENSKILAGVIAEMAEEDPEAARKATKIAREIRITARRGCNEIKVGFRKCVARGGPNQPVEDEEK